MATAPPNPLVPSFSERLWSDEVGMVAGPEPAPFRGYEFSSGRSFVAPMATPPDEPEPA